MTYLKQSQQAERRIYSRHSGQRTDGKQPAQGEGVQPMNKELMNRLRALEQSRGSRAQIKVTYKDGSTVLMSPGDIITNIISSPERQSKVKMFEELSGEGYGELCGLFNALLEVR